MTNISSRTLRQFLTAASLALAIPVAMAASPAGMQGGAGCDAMDGHGKQGRHGGNHGMGGEYGAHHLRGLNLTEAQRDKVFTVMHAQAPEMREKGKALRKAEDDLRQLSAAADFDEGKAKALSDELGKATFEATLVRARTERQINEILTPEQRQQMAERKAAGPRQVRHGDGPRRMMNETRKPAAS